MPEILPPEDMLAEIRDLSRRIKDLETAPQSNRAMLEDGNFGIRALANPNTLVSMAVDNPSDDAGFRVFTEDGLNRIYIGTYTDGAAAYIYLDNAGLIVNTGTIDVEEGALVVRNIGSTKETLDVNTTRGIRRPVIPVNWNKSYTALVDVAGAPYTASGSYEELWNGWINCSTHVWYSFFVNLQGSVTGAQFKITVTDYFSLYSGSGEQTVFEASTGVDVAYTQSSAIPTAVVSGSVPGSVLLLKVYARITAGSGSPGVSVAPIFPAIPSQS